jgi:hypothetical protein
VGKFVVECNDRVKRAGIQLLIESQSVRELVCTERHFFQLSRKRDAARPLKETAVYYVYESCPGCTLYQVSISLIYTSSLQTTVYILLLDSFTPRIRCSLCVKIANLVLCESTWYLFHGDGPFWIETCRNTQCFNII